MIVPATDLNKYKVRTIFAGSRNYHGYATIAVHARQMVVEHGRDIVFISGDAKTGADALIKLWCIRNRQPVIPVPAQWTKFSKNAGFIRNTLMSRMGTHLVAFWDGQSRGTKHMIEQAKFRNLAVKVIEIQIEKEKPWQ
jgi:hypothetical protein